LMPVPRLRPIHPARNELKLLTRSYIVFCDWLPETITLARSLSRFEM
jgi:hypothetical protein